MYIWSNIVIIQMIDPKLNTTMSLFTDTVLDGLRKFIEYQLIMSF